MREDYFALDLHTSVLTESTGSVTEKKEFAVVVWDRSVPVDGTRSYVTWMHVLYASNSLEYNALFMEHSNREKLVI